MITIKRVGEEVSWLKVCTLCGIAKNRETEFYMRPSGRRQRQCKSCLIKRVSDRVKCNKEVRSEYMRKYMREVKSGVRHNESVQLIAEAKKRPCTDCGGVFPPECMDFDHLNDEDKVGNVSQMLTWAVERVRCEIAKCEVVCANCHRIRTRKRKVAVDLTAE